MGTCCLARPELCASHMPPLPISILQKLKSGVSKLEFGQGEFGDPIWEGRNQPQSAVVSYIQWPGERRQGRSATDSMKIFLVVKWGFEPCRIRGYHRVLVAVVKHTTRLKLAFVH